MIRSVCFILMLIALPSGALIAGEGSLPAASTEKVDFDRDIQPLFKEHCYRCHGPSRQNSDFRLDVKSAALKGGESFAPAIIPGKSAESPLIRFTAGLVESMQMPPEGESPLSPREIGLLRAWIDQGANWPDTSANEKQEQPHWSFQPLRRPAIPLLPNSRTAWTKNPVDQFISAKMMTATGGDDETLLQPSPTAGNVLLLRRASFDLIGLPPTPEELDEFSADSRPDAFERLIDRLLASPHFGERWARHWLDVVRFAESDGFETNQPRPNAWPYRDYVIRSLNEDKPFDQFIFEQIAGDQRGVDEATGFIVGGAFDRVKSPDPGLTAQQRADELHDMVSTTSSAFMGLTVGCARCHNHKFDPISQADYYAIKAVFEGVRHGERPLRPADFAARQVQTSALQQQLVQINNQLIQYEPLAFVSSDAQPASPPDRLRAPVRRQANIDRFPAVKAKFLRFEIDETSGGEPCLDEIEVFASATSPVLASQNVALSTCGTRVTSSSNLPGFDIHQLKFVNDGRYGNSASWISNEAGRGWIQLEFAQPVDIDRVLWSRDRPEEGQFQDRIPTKYRIQAGMTADDLRVVATSADRLPFNSQTGSAIDLSGLDEEQRKAATDLVALRDSIHHQLKSFADLPMIYAGRFNPPEPTYRLHRGDPLQPKEPALPAGLNSFGKTWQLPADAAEQDRRLALAEWMVAPDHPLPARVMVNRVWHFHFGQGIVTTPSDFGKNGAAPSHPELLDWLALESRKAGSAKRIHRMLMSSATYQQSSDVRPEAAKRDAGTRLLWRYPPRRLEAEAIRDAILTVCGNLDDRMYGVGFDLFEHNTNYVKVYNTKRTLGPSEWRRMVYQTKPRMQLDEIFGQFDCPDAGQISPRRTSSITSLQALNLLNSRFVLQQSTLFADHLESLAGRDTTRQIQQAFVLAFQRTPTDDEVHDATRLIHDHGLNAFCRAVLNANEFLFVF